MKHSQAREKVMGAVPPKESKPSPEQITVFMNKVVTRGGSPYAVFSVLMVEEGLHFKEQGGWRIDLIPHRMQLDVQKTPKGRLEKVSPKVPRHVDARESQRTKQKVEG